MANQTAITEIKGHGPIAGHWHWEEYGNNYWDIIMTAPVRGNRYSWQCVCPELPTHEIHQNASGSYRPDMGKPINYHREW